MEFSPPQVVIDAMKERLDRQKAAGEKTTLLILCHPHSPTGRVWAAAELKRLDELCVRYRR